MFLLTSLVCHDNFIARQKQFFANKEKLFVYFVVYMETGYLEGLFRATFS